MQIIFAQTDVAAIKKTIIAVAKTVMTIPGENREIILRDIAAIETFGPVEIEKIAANLDPQHLCISMTAECGIVIEMSTAALQAQLGLVEEYADFISDVIAMAMPIVRMLKKFEKKITSSARAAAEMLKAKKPQASGSWADVEVDIRAAKAADLARQRGEQQTDWSAA